MMIQRWWLGALALMFGCSSGLQAEAIIGPKSGSTINGKAAFTADGDVSVTMVLELTGATAGKHGVHLHEKPDCSAEDGMSAGPHWNPLAKPHGNPASGDHHYGDATNIDIGPDGTGILEFTSGDWKIASTSTVPDVVGHAIIIHEKVDDLGPANNGNAGARQGCGVIVNKL